MELPTWNSVALQRLPPVAAALTAVAMTLPGGADSLDAPSRVAPVTWSEADAAAGTTSSAATAITASATRNTASAARFASPARSASVGRTIGGF
ncbi:MAG: hypothetical protein R2725_05790 [Solirubrobacterales bacterium]